MQCWGSLSYRKDPQTFKQVNNPQARTQDMPGAIQALYSVSEETCSILDLPRRKICVVAEKDQDAGEKLSQ